MNNLMKSVLLIVLLSISYISSAQKSLDKGSITMEITAVASDDPQTEMMLGAMKGSQTEVVFEGSKHVTNMDMMGGMVKMQIHVNSDANKMNMLFDAMGNKMWIESDIDKSQDPKQKEIADKSVITYDKNDTKEILGYKCYKMTIKNDEMEGMKVTGYVTSDVKTNANLIQGFQSLKFEGYPMEFTVGSPQFSMTMTAKEIKETVDQNKFNLDTKGYKKMTMEEFQNAMGGMGMGF
jgi:hypothetical protein